MNEKGHYLLGEIKYHRLIKYRIWSYLDIFLFLFVKTKLILGRSLMIDPFHMLIRFVASSSFSWANL